MPLVKLINQHHCFKLLPIKTQLYQDYKEVFQINHNIVFCFTISFYFHIDADRARKHGMDEYISADPCKFSHHQLFRLLQRDTLVYRLNDAYCSLGWFSPGQVFVLDEYCARYGVRTCFRHLSYLCDLLEFAEKGMLIDPTLIHYSFAFCSSQVHGNRLVSSFTFIFCFL